MDADILETEETWLPEEDLSFVRERVPTVYVQAVPVRTDHLGLVERVGLLQRTDIDGTSIRALVSGRVLFGETIREALWRHLAKDLGPDAEPVLPPEVAPFTVAEYFPSSERTGFSDARQHAVALVFIVPIAGECEPTQDNVRFSWLGVEDATSSLIAAEMLGGQDRLVRRAMAHVGRLS